MNIEIFYDNDLYENYLTVIGGLIGKNIDNKFIPNPLSHREFEVFVELMKLDNEFKSLAIDKRAEYLNSSVIRKKIQLKLKLSAANYNNLIKKISEKLTVFGNQLYNNGVLAPEFTINEEETKIEIKYQFKKVVPTGV